MGLLGSGIIKI